MIYGVVTVIITNEDVVYYVKVPWNAFRACILLTNVKSNIDNTREFHCIVHSTYSSVSVVL